MKISVFILLAFFVFCAGCDLQERERELQKKEAALDLREHELLSREQTIQRKEAELARKEQTPDSTSLDSVQVVNPALTGRWDVQMTCTETTCTGSAVGDTKTEQWEMAYEGSTLVAKAKASDRLVREYTGSYTGSVIQLANHTPVPDTTNRTTMFVRLRMVDETNLEGQREIVRDGNCKIVYAMKLQKK